MPRLTKALFLIAMLVGTPALAHHAFVAVYDPSQVVEIEGEILTIAWRNPHVTMTVRTVQFDADPVDWIVEGNAKSMLTRMNIPEGLIKQGDHVRLAGNPANRSQNRLFVTNILLADGRELVTVSQQRPRWADRALGTDSIWLRDGTPRQFSSEEPNIFRVWSTNLADRGSFPIWNPSYSLTGSASAALEAWRENSHVILECQHFGMPTIMASPFPVEFVDRGSVILFRIESFNAERTIYMRHDKSTENHESSPLGYSTGIWEGRSLVISTSDIDWHHFDQAGVSQGANVSLLERLTPSEDGRRLNYRLTVNDPATFTEPVVLEKHWVWRPNESLEHYTDDEDCAQ